MLREMRMHLPMKPVLCVLACACAGVAMAGTLAATALGDAVPVWHKGHEAELNEQLLFRGTFRWREGEDIPLLRLAASNPYRVKLNGAFVWYGPARGPKRFFRMDELPMAPRSGVNELEIECAGYNCSSFYLQRQPSFLVASLTCGGKTLLKTAVSPGDGVFAATESARVKRVSRYSHARPFGEVYVLPEPSSKPLELSECDMPALLPRRAATPDFSVADDFVPLMSGACAYDAQTNIPSIGFVDAAGRPGTDGYPKAELEHDLWSEQHRFRLESGQRRHKSATYALENGRYVLFEAPVNRTGFPALSVKCLEPGELHLLFDERPVANEFKPWRSKVANDVVWRFTRPGAYEIEAFEPYVLKAAAAVAKSGRFEISAPRLRLYRNAESRRARFRSSDAALEKLFAAAEENFAQNSVDGFMDCPGRERGNWNCDAYFTARAGALLTGNVSQETLFLENFAMPPHFDNVARGMIPMCYPADFATGNYIPSWAMFFVLQLDEYMRLRGGDEKLAAALKPRVLELVDFISRYRNSDGLLEKLPRWVFVEWSAANGFVQDVNYPNNMIWAATLEAVDRLYGRPELKAEAAKMKDAIRSQSWTGEWFCDNAVRQKDGTLKISGECTETCQYYAFYFGTATPESHPVLYRRLVDEFGPGRVAAGRYPKIHPSAPFIGNFLRLDWLGRNGHARRLLDEMPGYFLYMAKRTGTIWENADSSDNGSCCHGFASHVSVFLVRDVMGVREIDHVRKTVSFTPPDDVPVDYCEVDLPVGKDMLKLGWRRKDGLVEQIVSLPKGWNRK